MTVVDAKAFSGDLTTCLNLLEKYKDAEEEDDRTVSQLLIDQIEFANVILLNKTDLVTEKESASIEKAIKVLNPSAKVIRTVKSQVPLKEVMKTNRFNMEEAERSAGWLKSLTEEMVPETEEYGISSFVYRSRTPFHPVRLTKFLTSIFMINMMMYEEEEEEEDEQKNGEEKNGESNGANGKEEESSDDDEEEENEFNNVEIRSKATAERLANMRAKYGHIYRSKGFIWIAGKDKQYGEWSQAGTMCDITCGGIWVSCLPKDFWPDAEDPLWKKDFLPNEIADRRQEVVIIGADLDKEAITKALDECLLTKEETGKDGEHAWKLGFALPEGEENPVPDWPDADEEIRRASEPDDHEDGDGHGPHHGHKH